MIETIRTVAGLLTRDAVTVSEVAAAIGEVQGGGQPGVPIRVAPRDPGVKDVRVARNGESDEPSHVDLAPAEPFPMSGLVTAFGPFREVPRLPAAAAPPRVCFNFEPAGPHHGATIFASYREASGGPAKAMVVAVMVRRD